MFGLEGTGFTIAIAVTLLLAGIVAFYCKQRMDQLDKKLESMLHLNKALANSHAALEQRVYTGTVSMNTNVPATETTTHTEDFDGSNVNSVAMTDNRQVVSDDDSEDDSESDDSDSDSDSEDENEKNMEETLEEPIAIGSELPQDNNNDGIKVVELGGNETANDDIQELDGDLEEVELAGGDDDEEDDDDDDDDDDSELTDLSSTDLSASNKDLIKQIITKEVQDEVDIKKLNVAALRNLAVTRNLKDKASAKKMKKAELLQLLS